MCSPMAHKEHFRPGKSLTGRRLHVTTAFLTGRWATPGDAKPRAAPPHASPTSRGNRALASGPPAGTRPASLGTRGWLLSAGLNGTSQRFDLEGRIPPFPSPSFFPSPPPKAMQPAAHIAPRAPVWGPNSASIALGASPSSCSQSDPNVMLANGRGQSIKGG